MSTSAAVRRRPGPGRVSAPRSELLLRRYHCDHSAADREMLVRRYLPFARMLAWRYASPSAPYEDLAQVASVGLVYAIDRYDPARGTSFRTFAAPTIKGEIKRYFRDATWTVHVARAAKERAFAVERATDHLGAHLGRSPTVHEICGHLELGEEDVLDALQVAQAYSTTSLDVPHPTDGGEEEILENRLSAEDERYEQVEDKIAVRGAMSSLGRRDALILRLRFGKELSQREIGARLGISQMQVSRLLRRALARLRALASGEHPPIRVYARSSRSSRSSRSARGDGSTD